MQKGLVSIIVPVYNVEKFLPDCLDSIENQTFKNIEVIFVNDGSTDNSKHLLEDFCNKHNYAKLINQENQGLPMARNVGMHHAAGEFFTFLDSDDMIHPQMIELLYNAILKSGADFSCGCNQTCVEQKKYNEVKWKKYLSSNIYKHIQIVDKSNLVRFISGQNIGTNCSAQVKLIKAEILKKIPTFPNITPSKYTLGEDYFLISNLLNYSNSAVVVKCKLHLWRKRKGSMSRNKSFNPKDINVLDMDNVYLSFAQRTKDEIKALKGKKAFHAIMVLFGMKKAKYSVKKDVLYTYKILKQNTKYFYSLKYHPWWYILMPICVLYFLPYISSIKNKK